MAKMNKKMIAICTVALGAVYGAGYFTTMDIQNKTQSSTAHSIASSIQQKNQGVTYKDGIYTGSGMNRIGSVTVSVTMKNNKIEQVEITDCETHYPEDYIQDLPNEAVQKQSANVDLVSGATLSSEDFITAVTEALGKAQV